MCFPRLSAALSARKSPPEPSSVGLSATGSGSTCRSPSSSNDAFVQTCLPSLGGLPATSCAVRHSWEPRQTSAFWNRWLWRPPAGSRECWKRARGLSVHSCWGASSFPSWAQTKPTLPAAAARGRQRHRFYIFIFTCFVLWLQCCLWMPSVNFPFRVGVDANGVLKAPLWDGTHTCWNTVQK